MFRDGFQNPRQIRWLGTVVVLLDGCATRVSDRWLEVDQMDTFGKLCYMVRSEASRYIQFWFAVSESKAILEDDGVPRGFFLA